MGCVSRADGSTFKRTQKSPPFQKAVAFLDLSHFRARAGVVGMSGFPCVSITGTNMCDKPPSGVDIFPSLLTTGKERD
jgi:hypothetical protein